LGKGKFGEVKLGKHIKNGRECAVKIMNKKNLTTREMEM
jgi:serine/threonine protein kinase